MLPLLLSDILLDARLIRWQGVDGSYSARFGYVSREIEAFCSHGAVVTLHELLNEMNKIKRSFFFYLAFIAKIDRTLQVFNYKGTSSVGSLLRTRQRTTTSLGAHVMKERLHGFWRVTYSINGKRQSLCCGSMGNLCFRNRRCASWVDDLLILQRARAKAHSCL